MDADRSSSCYKTDWSGLTCLRLLSGIAPIIFTQSFLIDFWPLVFLAVTFQPATRELCPLLVWHSLADALLQALLVELAEGCPMQREEEIPFAKSARWQQ